MPNDSASAPMFGGHPEVPFGPRRLEHAWPCGRRPCRARARPAVPASAPACRASTARAPASTPTRSRAARRPGARSQMCGRALRAGEVARRVRDRARRASCLALAAQRPKPKRARCTIRRCRISSGSCSPSSAKTPTAKGCSTRRSASRRRSKFLTSGYDANIDDVLNNALFTVDYSEMVIVQGHRLLQPLRAPPAAVLRQVPRRLHPAHAR